MMDATEVTSSLQALNLEDSSCHNGQANNSFKAADDNKTVENGNSKLCGDSKACSAPSGAGTSLAQVGKADSQYCKSEADCDGNLMVDPTAAVNHLQPSAALATPSGFPQVPTNRRLHAAPGFTAEQAQMDADITSAYFKSRFISIDATKIASLLQPWLEHGFSRAARHGVKPEDLHIYVPANADVKQYQTVISLVCEGTPMFDAMLYLSLNVKDRPAVYDNTTLPARYTKDPAVASQAYAYVFFYLLVRGSPPGAATNVRSTPAFLKTIMGCTEAPAAYAERVASFDLNRITHTWIRQVPLPRLSLKARNHFALGVAGYRSFAPFAHMPFDRAPQGEILTSATAVRNFVMRGLFWEVQSVTRSPTLLERMGTPSRELGNLMLKVFTDDQLDGMVKSRMIFAIPTFSPRDNRHMHYNDATFDFVNQPIFPE